jgi:cytochrome c553
MRASAKLTAGFGVLLLVALGMGYYCVVAIGSLGQSLVAATDFTAKKMQIAGEMRAGFQQMRAEAAKTDVSLTAALAKNLDSKAGTECAACHSADSIAGQMSRFDAAGAAVAQSVGTMRPLVFTGEERARLDVVDAGASQWRRLYNQYFALARRGSFSQAHGSCWARSIP